MFWPRNWRLSQNPNDQPLQILSIHSIWPRVANDVRYRNRNLRKSVTRTIFTLLLENIENIVWNTSQSDCITFAYANDHNTIRGWLCCWRRCIRNFRNNDSRYFWVSNVTVSNVPHCIDLLVFCVLEDKRLREHQTVECVLFWYCSTWWFSVGNVVGRWMKKIPVYHLEFIATHKPRNRTMRNREQRIGEIHMAFGKWA